MNQTEPKIKQKSDQIPIVLILHEKAFYNIHEILKYCIQFYFQDVHLYTTWRVHGWGNNTANWPSSNRRNCYCCTCSFLRTDQFGLGLFNPVFITNVWAMNLMNNMYICRHVICVDVFTTDD